MFFAKTSLRSEQGKLNNALRPLVRNGSLSHTIRSKVCSSSFMMNRLTWRDAQFSDSLGQQRLELLILLASSDKSFSSRTQTARELPVSPRRIATRWSTRITCHTKLALKWYCSSLENWQTETGRYQQVCSTFDGKWKLAELDLTFQLNFDSILINL